MPIKSGWMEHKSPARHHSPQTKSARIEKGCRPADHEKNDARAKWKVTGFQTCQNSLYLRLLINHHSEEYI